MRTLLTRALRELADKRKTLALLSLEFCYVRLAARNWEPFSKLNAELPLERDQG